jgi:hypothetical protein
MVVLAGLVEAPPHEPHEPVLASEVARHEVVRHGVVGVAATHVQVAVHPYGHHDNQPEAPVMDFAMAVLM